MTDVYNGLDLKRLRLTPLNRVASLKLREERPPNGKRYCRFFC